jgi:hypothetical protein
MNQPRVIAYMPLHYGAEYLTESIKSVAPFVEKIIIFYTSRPSYGFSTETPCPEHEVMLRNQALAASVKVEWISGYWGNEGTHRNQIFQYTSGYDIVLTFDADEVFDQSDLPNSLNEVFFGNDRFYGVNGYVNFWRSFNHEVIDFFRPIRFINLHNQKGQGEVKQRIYHFSCAQSKVTMDYKYKIHGHHDELKKNWLQEKYYNWTPGCDIKFLHPTSDSVWGEAFEFDKTKLPELLKQHPNYNKDVI